MGRLLFGGSANATPRVFARRGPSTLWGGTRGTLFVVSAMDWRDLTGLQKIYREESKDAKEDMQPDCEGGLGGGFDTSSLGERGGMDPCPTSPTRERGGTNPAH